MNRINKLRLSLSGLLTISACMGVWLSSTSTVLAQEQLDCLWTEAPGETGCIAKPQCAWYAPNTGITWSAEWKCCYNSHNKLQSATSYSCKPHENGGCCNNLDGAPHCPVMECHPAI